MNKSNHSLRVERFARWVIRWRWAVILMVLAQVACFASFIPRLNFHTDYRVFFSKENPHLVAFEALQDIYTQNDNILFVVVPEDGDAFSPRALAAVEALTREAWQLPYALRVDSVTNFQHTEAEGDTLYVADLVGNAENLSPEAIESARRIALNEPLLLKRLVSESAHVSGVNVTFQLPGMAREEVSETVVAARALESSFLQKYPELDVALTGILMLDNAFTEASILDLKTLIPLMAVVLVAVMWLLLRSWAGTLVAVLIVAFSGVTAMGAAGWLNMPITPPSAEAPIVIMTLAVADSIHILVTMINLMRKGLRQRKALIESLRINMTPVFLTSLTTVIGFLSMNFSDAPPFRDLGNLTAIGITAAFIYSIFLLPALLSILPVKAASGRLFSTSVIERVGNWVVRHHRRIFRFAILTTLGLAAMIPLNELNDQWVRYFDRRIEFRRDTDFVMENLTGLYSIEYSIESGESGGISNPQYLEILDAFAAWFREQPGVVQVQSLSDTMKRLNKNMHGDAPAAYRLPQRRDLAAQYLLLFELSLPYGLDLNNMINIDKSAGRFTVMLENVSSRQLRRLADQGEQWLEDNAPEPMWARASSSSLMFAYISERNIRGMLVGTAWAVLLISIVMVVALRSLKLGVLSLVPNLVPAILGFGIWGLAVGQVNMALSVVTAMSLGIVIDDSVHFLSKYLRARREQGLDVADAVRYAFSMVGLALLVTTVILVIGFMVLTFSAFQVNAGMGRLTALIVALALVADFTLLPALLMRVERDGGPI